MADVNVTISASKGIAGDNGREIEIQNSGTHIQWRYVGAASWTNLIALSAITGSTGARGITPQGVYDSLTAYVVDDAVTHNGSMYICVQNTQGNSPNNVQYWTRYVAKGDTGPAGGVNSVNTRQGDITLDKTDVGLGNVDNTSDVNKPVSTATEAALHSATGLVAYEPMTWVTLLASYPAASNSGKMAKVSDIGVNPYSLWVSDGLHWKNATKLTLVKLNIPLGIAPDVAANASATANGASSFGMSQVNTYERYSYIYYSENVLNTNQPAGFYFTEVLNGGANFVAYNNVYTPSVGVYPSFPTTLVPFSGAVPGGAGSTAEITALYVPVKGKMMGDTGALVFSEEAHVMNNANAKYLRVKSGSAQVSGFYSVLNNGSELIGTRGYFANLTKTTQRCTGGSNSGAVQVRTAVNTENDFSLSVTLQKSVGNDILFLGNFRAEFEA